MLPKQQEGEKTVMIKEIPSLTYGLNQEKAEITGQVDGIDAMKQAIQKMLWTERYQFLIYDWNYGIEIKDLIGKNISFVIPELQKRIEEALLADDRVDAVGNFSFQHEGGAVTASFTVETKEGTFTAERVVKI